MLQTVKKQSTLLSPDLLKPDQESAIDRLFNFDATLLVAGMGFGKTIVTLTAVQELLADGVIKRVLVVAPLEVCKTVWREEAAKWSHTSGLNIGAAIGSEKERLHALNGGDQVVLINFENLVWLCKQTTVNFFGFDALVVDELSKLKSSGGEGFKKLRSKLKFFNWRVGLTGTPVSEDFIGLYGQCLVLDGGARLGTRRDKFMETYFYPTDFMRYNWALKDASGATLLNAVRGLIYVTDDVGYKASLPPIHHHLVTVELPNDARMLYEAMRIDMMVEGVTADNAAVLVGKLAQLANGFLYLDGGDAPKFVHDAKLLECKRLVAGASGNVIIAAWFKEDFARLREAFPSAVAFKDGDSLTNIERWNRGEIPVLLIQPRSAGHGVQLQFGGSTLVWYSPVWSRDLTEQTEARIWRRGQGKPVDVYTVCAGGTIDVEIASRVEGKAGFKRLLEAHMLRP